MNKPKSYGRAFAPKETRPATPKHKRIEDRERTPFYHTYRWRKHSEMFRAANPLCVDCEAEGMATPSQVCDHEPPLAIQLQRGIDPYNTAYQVPRCKRHHAQKSSKDRKYFR